MVTLLRLMVSVWSVAPTAKLPNGEHFVFGNKVEPAHLFLVVQVKVIQRVETLIHPPLVAGHPALDGDALRSRLQHKLLQVVKLDLRRWRSLLAEREQCFNTNSRKLRAQNETCYGVGLFRFIPLPFSSSLCPFSSLIFPLSPSRSHRYRLPFLKDTQQKPLDAFQRLIRRAELEVNLPFFFFFSLSLSLSPDVWNMDAEPAVDFFFDLADFVSSSLSSLSDLAAADKQVEEEKNICIKTNVTCRVWGKVF